MNIFQRQPHFELGGAYNAETNMVEIRWQAGIMPPVALGLPPESFFEFCDKIINQWSPFIEALKAMVAAGVKEDLDIDIDLDKLIELKKRWEAEDDKEV